MSTTFASLGIAVESSQAVKAADDLDKLVNAAEGAEKAVDDLGKAGEGLANTGKKISQAEAEAAQGIDKATSAKERQVDASRKAGTSAAGEIAIISQLDRAMTGNIDSMEKLVQAEGLLERARKGGLVTIEQQETYQERLGKSFDKIEKAEAKEAAQKQRLIDAENRQIEALKRTVNSIDPLNVKLAKLEAQEKAAHEAFRLGAINAERYSEALAKVGKDRAGITATEGAFDKLKLGTRQAQENVMQLANALQSGDWGSGVRAVTQLGAGAGASAASLLALAAPIALVTAAIGTLAYAYYKGSEEQDAYNKSLILTGNYAGVSAGQLGDMARQVSATVGTTGQAAAVLAMLADNGKIAGESFTGITQAAVSMQEATGKAVSETVAEFSKLADDPVKASAALNEQYHYLTASVYSQIAALEEQGDHAGAVKLATEQYADAINERTPRILENLSFWEKGYNAVARAADNLKNVGRQDIGSDIEQARRNLARAQAGDIGAFQNKKVMVDFYQNRLSMLEDQKAAEEDIAKWEKEQAKAQLASQQAMAKVDALAKSAWTNEQKRNEALKEYRQQLDDIRKTDPHDKRLDKAVVDKNIANINDKFKNSKTAAGAVDLTAFNTSKNTLTGILSEYKNAQKELDAAQKAGLVSQADYLLKREALIGNERDEVTAAYEAEIAALEAAKGKASTSAAQRIQLDQKIADARAAMVKAQQDADTELSVLAKNEEGRLKKQELAVKTYTSALQQQVDTLREQGLRAAAGLGQGDRQRDLTNQQNVIDDRINQQKLDLANQYGDGSRGMSLDEYTQKLQALEITHQQLRDTTVSNYADMTAAQGDWSNGASAAWQNYYDDATNFSSQTQMAFTNAFSGMNDALYEFVTTGKLSFDDMAATFASTALRMLIQWGTAQVAMAALNAFTSTAAIPLVGPLAAPAAAASALGQTGSFMATISSVAGMAHDGMDYIPREGTWLLDKGERVVDSRTNADLKRYLASEPGKARGQDNKSGDLNIPIQVTVQGQPGMSDAEARRQGQLAGEGVRDIVRQVIQQEQRPGGMLA